MSQPAQLAKLEDLLERIQKNRRPTPGPLPLGAAARASEPAEAPAPERLAAGQAPLEHREPNTEERLRLAKPTPMEEALETEFEAHADVDIEVSFEDEGPELTIDEEGTLESAPAREVASPAPASSAPEPLLPQPIETAPAEPSQPIARVLSRPAAAEPQTFGTLLARTLALRPR